jgi:hypothetical protein
MARIVRTQRTADHFTIIANAAVRDVRLSWKARGLLVWLLSHQEGWETSVKDLAKHAPDGKGSVETGLQELEACGYLERRQVRDAAGKMGATEYHVTDEYQVAPDEPRPENRVTDTATRFSVTGSAGTRSSDPKKNIPQNTNHQNTSSDARSASTAPPVDPDAGIVDLRTARDPNAPEDETGESSRDASGARHPWRPFPNQCSGHQDSTHTGGCWGCKRTRETNLTNDQRRTARITEALEVIDAMPPCRHGKPGGAIPHPEHPDTLTCPLCRVDAPADDQPPQMTREGATRLHGLLAASERA